MVGVLEGVGTHTHHETTPNHTQRAGFPPPTAEQGSNDVKSGGIPPTFYVTIPARAASQYYLLNRIFVSVIPSDTLIESCGRCDLINGSAVC